MSLYCSEAMLHSTTNVYFLLSPMITVLYPTSNYFDSWALHIPLNRQMTPTLILRERHQPPQYLKKNKVIESG